MSAIITPELMRRYMKVTGQPPWREASIDRAVLGMLAAAEMLRADLSNWDEGSHQYNLLAAHAERLVEAAGVGPRAWKATR